MSILTLEPTSRDLGGGFVVRRVLPQIRCRSVGPFVFLDHFGPLAVKPDDNHDVRAHPHIGLATVTYLFDGAMQHRDSIGANQRIEPGAINWMTAGRGIVHSERRPESLRGHGYSMHGLQLWVALPEDQEQAEPAFEHTGAERIPQRQQAGVALRVLVGEAHGLRSPVSARSPTLFVEYRLDAGAEVELPAADERALYGVDAPFFADGDAVVTQQLALLAGDTTRLSAGDAPARVVLVGGTPLGPRHMWWNFVASDPARIEAAAAAWQADTFGAVPGEEHDRTPLPAVRWRRP